MFSSQKFMTYLRKPSTYEIRRILPQYETKEKLKKIRDQSMHSVPVSNTNPVYREAHELIKR